MTGPHLRAAALASLVMLVTAGLPARAADLGTSHDTPRCTIKGTPDDDQLHGTARDDVICGLGGDDVISGQTGNDTLVGGKGEDELRSGSGDDTLRGEGGRDTASFAYAEVGVTASLRGGTAAGLGEDRIEGVESLTGSQHDDSLEGSSLSNVLDGLGGGDRLIGLGGADRLHGDSGEDVLRGNSGPDLLTGGAGSDHLLSGTGNDGCLLDLGGGTKFGCEIPAYARAGGLVLYVPSGDPVGFGYHESLFGSAFALRPLGHLERNANPSKFSPPAPTDGPGYVVMDTRDRPTPATSSTDIVLPSHSMVSSPVDATVVDVQRYRLYCRAPDWKVVLRPDDSPTTRVLVLHMQTPYVEEGQRVTAIVSVLGITHANDTSDAQENRYFPDRYPHVHIEVERNGASPTPGCPI